jgi:hypothetical protein
VPVADINLNIAAIARPLCHFSSAEIIIQSSD